MARISIFTSFSNTDTRIKLLLKQLRFTVDDFVLTCFEQLGKFRFCLKSFFLRCCGCCIYWQQFNFDKIRKSKALAGKNFSENIHKNI